jgi:hypothetical protein
LRKEYSFLIFIPLIGFFIHVLCLSAPKGAASDLKIDKTGVAILLVYSLLIIVIIFSDDLVENLSELLWFLGWM